MRPRSRSAPATVFSDFKKASSSVMSCVVGLNTSQATGTQRVRLLARLRVGSCGRLLTIANAVLSPLHCWGPALLQTVRALSTYASSGAVASLLNQVNNKTGYSITLIQAPLDAIAQTVLDSVSSLGRGYFDAWLAAGGDTVDLMEAGLPEPLGEFIDADEALNYTDVHK